MISVVVYGRNDSHGYNPQKRAAISLNCIAQVLTHPNDEIIFLDCNTPDDMPTFPESIQDTLSSRARQMLRVLRLRPAQFKKHNRGSPFNVFESLCRNAAIRRSNPANRWILSTNTDIIFVPRNSGHSLSDAADRQSDGYYGLPRFEIPCTLWEALDRTDPETIISTIHHWGSSLHLNEIMTQMNPILYDNPGDFQLMPREQLFAIHGFDEEMLLSAHQDSNLCTRLCLLNGGTNSLLDHYFAYHCDHTRVATYLHKAGKPVNDFRRFVLNVKSPFLPNQAQNWGLPCEEIEEIRLDEQHSRQFSRALENIMPGLSSPFTKDTCRPSAMNRGHIYDTLHVFPFLADHLMTFPQLTNVGYIGGNAELLHMLANFFSLIDKKGRLFVDHKVFRLGNTDGNSTLPGMCAPVELETLLGMADIIILDLAMMNFPQHLSSDGFSVPSSTQAFETYRKELLFALMFFARVEQDRLQQNPAVPRKLLIIGSRRTGFESIVSQLIGAVQTPNITHVQHGYVQKKAFDRTAII